MQLQPHFLFNAMNSISALLRKDVKAADRMLMLLGDFLRLTLDSTYSQLVTFKRELMFIKAYLDIEQVRFPEEVLWIKSEGNYVKLHVQNNSFLLRESISKLSAQLNPQNFRRIHRTTIVNLNYMSVLQPLFHGDYNVVLKDGTKLTLSRNYKANIPEI